MTAQQRTLLDRLFAEAAALPREEQRHFLAENCDDPQVWAELGSLLAFDTNTPPRSFFEAIGETAASLTGAALIGQRLGPYRLTGKIGQGGMGTVYRAVRDDDEFQLTVAIKMLRFSQGDSADVQHFRRERQILATLEHPHVARLLDGGAWIPPGSAESQPYLVMEYVEGMPLTTYCEETKRNVRQRLMLFRQVCDALSYAHQRLVVHRDIKPANILVAADGTPKLLDFGIAKLLDRETGTGAGTVTSAGLRAMTPDYASPEQVRGEPVSTVTDVYSLGAVLYELLTGRRPHQLVTYSPQEIASKICEGEVQPPSVVGGRHLRGDLDVIVLKAMQKEPARRYRSVEQLSEDIWRYLEGMPVVARPDTLAYRAVKFIQRHRLGLVGVGAVFLALVGGVAASTWQARRARRAEQTAVSEKQRADAESAIARAVNDFLQNDVLAQAGASAQARPNTKPDPDLKVRTALERAAAGIRGKFEGQPLVEASIRQTIGKAYLDLGLYPEAQKHMEQALAVRRRALGEGHPVTLSSANSLGKLYVEQGKFAEAEPLLSRLLAVERGALGNSHADTLATMCNLALLYKQQGKYPQAEVLATEALEGRRHVLGEEHHDTQESMSNLGVLYFQQAKYAQAEPLLIKTLEISRLLGEEHPDVLSSMNNVVMLYAQQGKYEHAEPLFIKILEVQQRVLGNEHPEVLTTMNNLGMLYFQQGKYRQAEPLFVKTLEGKRRALGREHPGVLTAANNLGRVYVAEGRYSTAEPLLIKLLEVHRRVLGQEHHLTLVTMINVASVYQGQGKYSQAEALDTKVVEARRRVSGEEHPYTLYAMHNLAMLYRVQGQFVPAKELLTKVVEIGRRVLGEAHPQTTIALASLGEIQIQLQKYADAEPLLRAARNSYENAGLESWRRYYSESALGASLAGQKKYLEAEPLLLTGYQEMLVRETTIPADNVRLLEQARKWIVLLYQDWGKPDRAAEWRNKRPTRQAAGPAPKR